MSVPQEELEPASIEVTDGALEALWQTHSWVKFLGIVSIVFACFAGLMLLIGASMLAGKGAAGEVMFVEGIVLLVVTVLYAVYWMGYSNSLKRLLNRDEVTPELLEDALVKQRRLWVYQGVLAIVFFVIGIIAAIASGPM